MKDASDLTNDKYIEDVRGRKVSLKHWQMINILLIMYDLFFVNVSYYLALWVRFDCRANLVLPMYFEAWFRFIPIYTLFCLTVFWVLNLYQSIWRFASYSELMNVIKASAITAVFHAVAITLIFRRMPISYYVLGAIFQFIFVLGIRFSYRFILLLRSSRSVNIEDARASRVMIVGAGSAGQIILRDINRAKVLTDKVLCFIDDNPNKWNRYIEGVPVVGGRDSIIENAEKYEIEKIYIAIPSASARQKKEIVEICKETGCELKNLPGMYQFVLGDISVKALKDVDVEDLLGREPIKINTDEVLDMVTDKTVLVTGGGGSIGSELCRQIAAYNPKCLIVFDIYENNAHEIKLELTDKYPDLNLKVLIGSVRDSKKLDNLFSTYRPDIVYHAAAHKHVPLMEDSPCEAIKNNVIGTYKTAYSSLKYGAKRFVLISTDKAVNPVNIMGASKRLCEMVIQVFASKVESGKTSCIRNISSHGKMDDENRLPDGLKTQFAAVRFGNVLGSNGSVIPRFREQIKNGGPVTVTHPDIIRYFMTIPEAVSLVLQAGAYAKGGEIFVLDMGTPVKIDDLARNLIKLSGLKPDVDIEVKYTGLRPGEKLYEEKLMAEEGLTKTENDLIHIGKPIPIETAGFMKGLNNLLEESYLNEKDIRKLVMNMVPTYKPEKVA